MQVKYLYGSFKKARVKKLSNEYLFYLQLKSIDFPQHEMTVGSLIKEIQKHLDCSASSISVQLKKLLKAGFVELYKHDSGKDWKYVLKSYRSVWNILGFRFRTYIDRYKFEFAEVSDKSSLKALIFTLELKRNKEHQEFKINEKLDNQIAYHEGTIDKVKSNKVREKKNKALLHLKSVKLSLVESHFDRGAERPMENRISCKRALKLLGYSSTKTISNLHKKAENKKYLSVIREKVLIAEGISRIEFSVNPKFDKCYWLFGKVYRNQCNVYKLNVNKIFSLQDKPLESL